MSSCKRRLLLLSSSSLLWLTCCAGVAVSQPQNQQEQSPQTIAPATGAPGNEQAPAASEKLTSPQPADQTNPAAPAMPPGTMTVAPITVTAPTAPPRRTAPREAPPTTALPTRAARAPTPPPCSVQPSTPAAAAPTQTQIFDQQRDNIFAPVGAASTTWSREAIEGAAARKQHSASKRRCCNFLAFRRIRRQRETIMSATSTWKASVFPHQRHPAARRNRRLRSIPRPQLRRQLEP